MENINDFKWNIISYAILMIYHFGILQIIALVSNDINVLYYKIVHSEV